MKSGEDSVEDGNGRLGRLLIPLNLLANKVIDRPIIYLSPHFEATRDEYIGHLKAVSTHGRWEAWISYFLRAVEAQANDSLLRITVIAELQEKYRTVATKGAKTKATLASVDLVMENVIVTAQDVAEYSSCSYNTAKAALTNVTELGIVQQIPHSYPQRWWAKELVDRVYEG